MMELEVFRTILGIILIWTGQKILQESEKKNISKLLFVVGMIVVWLGIACEFSVAVVLESR